MSRGRHEPVRQCAACRAERPKAELLRIVSPKDGEPALDESGGLPGRGAYLCRSRECLKKAIKKGSLARALHRQIPAELYEQIAGAIGEQDHA